MKFLNILTLLVLLVVSVGCASKPKWQYIACYDYRGYDNSQHLAKCDADGRPIPGSTSRARY